MVLVGDLDLGIMHIKYDWTQEVDEGVQGKYIY